MKAPANSLIVKVKTKWVKHFSDLAKRASIQNGSTVDPADYVNIVGEVIAIPSFITPFKKYKGFSTKDIKVGNTVLFSYLVIYDLSLVEEGQEPVHKNMFVHEGEEYFLADITKIFGVIHPTEIEMVNGWVMAGEYEESKIILPNTVKRTKFTVSSMIHNINHSRTHQVPLKAKQGDSAIFNKNHAQHYEINGKKFIILPQEKIYGIIRQKE